LTVFSAPSNTAAAACAAEGVELGALLAVTFAEHPPPEQQLDFCAAEEGGAELREATSSDGALTTATEAAGNTVAEETEVLEAPAVVDVADVQLPEEQQVSRRAAA